MDPSAQLGCKVCKGCKEAPDPGEYMECLVRLGY